MNQEIIEDATHLLEEDREPGQLRLEDLLKVPSNLTQAALYKYIADVAEQDNRRRKQKLVPRSSSSPGASSSEILDATSDRDELTDSGGSKQEKSKQTRRGKQVPSGSEASSANGSAGKAKVVKEPVKRVPAKKRKMNVIESDPEDDDESVIIDSSNEGGEQVDDTPSNKKPKTTTGAIRGQRKNVKSAKGKDVADAFSKGEEINLVELEEQRQEISIRIYDGYWLCHTQWMNGEWHIGLRRTFSNGGKQWMKLPTTALKSLLRAIPMLQERLDGFGN